jgi:ATP-dependent helicase/nuclease subunit A
MSADPQTIAADPSGSAFVSANAGSGKTKTLVDRVARLLLRRARPEAILCVTYTKAAAAEMQRRLFQQLGDWSVLDDVALARRLADIGEDAGDLSRARTLFARALEAPGGLKIETLHAFCEKLLRRFPLEAGVSPGFRVMDDAAAAAVAAEARDRIARLSLAGQPEVAAAYAAMATSLDFQSFEQMFATFETEREAIGRYIGRIGGLGALAQDVARAVGLAEPVSPDALGREAVEPPRLDPALWRAGAAALGASGARDQKCAAQMAAVAQAAEAGAARFEDAIAVFCTAKGEPAKWVETAAALKRDPALQLRLTAERDRLLEVGETVRAAEVAETTAHALTLAGAYVAAFEAAKARRGLLDFTDLTARTADLLAARDDAAWVLYKLDGGIDHVLLDEAQDTAPEQWSILRALTGEFFAGEGAAAARGSEGPRTVFIVGDEKQSIYSFQGARPERLAEEAERYGALADGAGHRFARVPLLASWRSTPQVLGFVDAVFAPDPHRSALQPRAEGSTAPAELIRHIANRADHQGAIDLWELEREEPRTDRRAWDEPLDAEAATGAYRRLAERIADEIARVVAEGERVHDKDQRAYRPAEYGDVLILVRKRKALFAELLRACKHRGVPVAGADRLLLSEHPVFEDLLALTRTALFPHDDLNLAAVLRSPLCDVDEDSLYALARGPEGAGRGGASLWAELGRRGEERADWRAALALLGWARREAASTPFTFYARLFSRLDEGGRSIRQRFVTRLGPEAADALDEVLAQALAAEGRGVHDLERFADGVARREITVKREMDAPREAGSGGEVRIMTAHSAKGLEAPIVFLPETVSGGAPRGSPLLATPDGGFLWCSSKAGDCAASGRVRALRESRAAQEDLRLLYVALTRARDRLVIAGRINARADVDKLKGWWGPMRDAFEHPAIAPGVRTLERDGRSFRRYGPDPATSPSAPAAGVARHDSPGWLARPAAPEAGTGLSAPSAAGEGARAPAASPLSQGYGLGRFRRGELIHRLLQVLPDLPPDGWNEAAGRLLDKERDLLPEQRAEMAASALAVLRDPRFAEVFGPGSRPEAALAGASPELPPGWAVSGRVDRLRVTPERVLVVDFKTNRPSPDRIEQADPAYVAQIAIYAAVLRAVFPDRRVEAALVWTDGPKLTPVPENLMREALRKLRPTPA